MNNRYKGKCIPEEIVWRFFVQMTQALAFIHGEKLLHRDIKPKNILVTYEGREYPSFKLIDFQLAEVVERDMPERETVLGTFNWQPPENPKINTKAAEVWSMGACVYFLATRAMPVEDTPETRARCARKFMANPQLATRYRNLSWYCTARMPRRVVPINADSDEQLQRRGTEPERPRYHRYSDKLNYWMSKCLENLREDRPTTAQLLDGMRNDARRELSEEQWVDMEL